MFTTFELRDNTTRAPSARSIALILGFPDLNPLSESYPQGEPRNMINDGMNI